VSFPLNLVVTVIELGRWKRPTRPLACRVHKRFSLMLSAGIGSDGSMVGNVSAQDPEKSFGMTVRVDEGAVDLNQSIRSLLDDVARALSVPLALLSRDRAGWQFEAEAIPQRPVAEVPRFSPPAGAWPSPAASC